MGAPLRDEGGLAFDVAVTDLAGHKLPTACPSRRAWLLTVRDAEGAPAAGPDIAVHGDAADDVDFGAPGDRVRYEVQVGDAPGPFRVRAELWYQPIGFRWARNLSKYDAVETNRFVRYFESLSHVSGTVLAETELRIE